MRALISALAVAASAVVTVGAGPSVATAAPAGFSDTVVTNVGTLTTVEALPDGRVVVLEQNGRLLRIDDRDGSSDVTTMANLDVCRGGERGLLGFTADPAFVTNGFVYIYRTITSTAPGGCHNRVSRFVMNESGLVLGSERVLVDLISAINTNHNGGDIEIGNDGFLYIATGDAGRDPRGNSGSGGSNDAGQDLSLLNGKILRVSPSSGLAAPGNPFSGPGTADCRLRGNNASTPTTTCREIFSYGLRNPYRFAFDPNTSATRFFINDVGQNTLEEVNEGQIGANYGWPIREGRCPQGQTVPCPGPTGGLVDPISDYGRASGGFVTGGAFIPNGFWPAQYDGGYLVSDGATGTTWVFRGESNLADAEVFLTASAPTDMTFVTGPNGPELWYVQQNGQVHKVTHNTPAGAADSGPLRYEPLPSIERRFDTRDLTPSAPLRGGTTRLVDLEAPAGAEAALVNITLARPQAAGAFVTAWQPRTQRPATATANADVGDVVANASIVPVDADGNVLLFALATTDIIVDVAGFYFGAPDPVRRGRLETVDPFRLVDTRSAPGDLNDFQRVTDGAGDVVTATLDGPLFDMPADLEAVVLIVTGIQSAGPGAGFVTVTPNGATRPDASNLNVNPGTDVRANLVVTSVANGSVDLYLERVRDVTVDVAGYMTSSSAAQGTAGLFHLVAPAREVDTRLNLGFDAFSAGDVRTLDPISVPASASAVAQNLTMIRTGDRGFVTGFPGGIVPMVSSVNAAGANQTRGALGIVPTGTGGTVSYFSEAATHLSVDVFGWFE